MRAIFDVAAELGLSPDELMVFGEHIAKLRLSALPDKQAAPKGKLILVSAINPTRAGEGKTTVSIGLAQGLKQAGNSVALALREPSLGPIFGIKGGGTGGGGRRVSARSGRRYRHHAGTAVATRCAMDRSCGRRQDQRHR